jgi:putative ABC transport system substrate-binding protein
MLLSRHTKRREVITLLGGAAAVWPLAARAQQSAMPVIGFLSLRTATDTVGPRGRFRQALNEQGYVESRRL